MKNKLAEQLATLGVRPGDVVMVHASLKAIGPVDGGPSEVAGALMEAIAPAGTLMAYVSWDRSPYEETLNGAVMSAAEKAAWPGFDPLTAGVYIGFGALNAYLVRLPGARRSGHPDASMAAIGPAADFITSPHPLDSAYGTGSPLQRFVDMKGKVLLLGAPPDAVTVLHYAEAIAPIAGKRRIRYEMPLLGPDGRVAWHAAEDFDSNGILDVYAVPGQPDAVERIARDYLALGRHAAGRVGHARAQLIDAQDIVRFGVDWLVGRHGG